MNDPELACPAQIISVNSHAEAGVNFSEFEITFYIDGSAQHSTTPRMAYAAAAAVLQGQWEENTFKETVHYVLYLGDVMSQQAEVIALLKALQLIPKDVKARICTNSIYVAEEYNQNSA